MPTASARMMRKSSAPRRRRCTNPMRAPDWAIRSASHRGRGACGRGLATAVGVLPGGQVVDGRAGVVEVLGVDALADLAGVEVGEPVELDVGRLVGGRQ